MTRGPDGGVHWYEIPGGGEGTLVLQHGIGAEGLHFLPIVPFLRPHFRRLVLPDLPGHGRSDAPGTMSPEAVFEGVTAALDEALDEPAVVFGNSLGGAMMTQFALERPDRTSALVLASPAGAILPEERLRDFLSGFDFADRRAVLAFFARLNPKVPLGAQLFAGDVRANFARPAIRALLASVRSDHGIPAERLAALAPPTLLLWGQRDKLMPPEMFDWYRAHLPASAIIEEPEDVGHCPQVDRPSWTARRILTFKRQLSGGG